MSCKMYTPHEGPDGMLLERNGKLNTWKSKSSRLSYSLVESLPPLSMINVRNETKTQSSIKCKQMASVDVKMVDYIIISAGFP